VTRIPCARIVCLTLVVVSGAACTPAPYTRTTPPPVVERGIPSSGASTAPATSVPPGAYEHLPGGQAPAPPRAEPPAVVALLDHAEQQANSGDLPAAALTLERAIRIDPRNPILWHHLATVRLAEGNSQQAEELAKKSNALAGGNYALQVRNWDLIARARRARGDTSGAQSAERQKQALQAR
jgi:tetratricopeptide (TPR) repeat protein